MPPSLSEAVVGRIDRLAADLAAAILRLRPSEVEPTIDVTLRRLGEALDADRTTFETFAGDAMGRLLRVWTRPAADTRGATPVRVPVSVEGHALASLTVAGGDERERPLLLDERLKLLADLLVLTVQRGQQLQPERRMPAGSRDDHDDVDTDDVIGESFALRSAVARVLEVAPTEAPVVLLGENGTGKELFARAIHNRSPRRLGPFVRVNCAALPPALVESELFGHERGAFTGATSMRQGRIELAHAGTLFLDEIANLTAEVQAKLLRVLQEGEFERAGSPQMRRVDVRVVAATRHDLEQMVQAQQFRADLYYRLHVYPIALPALRERLEDIPRLVWFFINRRQRVFNKRFTSVPASVMETLQRHSWPGNVRELESVIERALVHSSGDTLRLDDGTWLGSTASADDGGTLEAVERRHIESVLRRCGGRINGPGNAAEALGMHPNTLRFRMKKLGIRRPMNPAAFEGFKQLTVASGSNRAAR